MLGICPRVAQEGNLRRNYAFTIDCLCVFIGQGGVLEWVILAQLSKEYHALMSISKLELTEGLSFVRSHQ